MPFPGALFSGFRTLLTPLLSGTALQFFQCAQSAAASAPAHQAAAADFPAAAASIPQASSSLYRLKSAFALLRLILGLFYCFLLWFYFRYLMRLLDFLHCLCFLFWIHALNLDRYPVQE